MTQLEEHYQAKNTEELMDIAKGDLTDIARKTLNDVLSSRGVKAEEVELAVSAGVKIRAESLELEHKRGSLGKRFLALLIDLWGVGIILFIVTSPFSLISESFHKNLVGFIFFTHFFIRDSILGQSLGKRILKLRVIQVKSGKSCTWEESLIRSFFLIFGLFDLLFALGENRRRLGDVIAGTMVINTASNLPNQSFKRDD